MQAIVTLTANDIDAIDAFHRLCFPEDYFLRADWEDLLADPRTIVYATRAGQGLSALLAIYNWQGEHDYVKIMTLCTHPAHRRQGLARLLLSQMTADLEQQGMRTFKAETRVSNLAMQALFDALGFERTKRVEQLMDRPPEDGFKYQLLR